MGSTDIRKLLITGVLSALLSASPWYLGGTKLERLEIPFWLPGFFAAGIVFQTGNHSDYPQLYMGLAAVLNFVFTWLVLLLITRFIKKSFIRRKEQE